MARWMVFAVTHNEEDERVLTQIAIIPSAPSLPRAQEIAQKYYPTTSLVVQSTVSHKIDNEEARYRANNVKRCRPKKKVDTR